MNSTVISNMTSNNLTINTSYSVVKIATLSVWFILMSAIIVFGNILVLLAIPRLPEPRQPSRILVGNLAVADLSLGILILPISSIHEILGWWPFERTFCYIWAFVDCMLCICSLYTLCTIAVDRYVGVTYPLRHNVIITDRAVVGMVIAVWTISFALCFPSIIGWGPPPVDDPTYCYVNTHTGYVILTLIGGYVLPFTLLAYLYTKIYLVARKTIIDITKINLPTNLQSNTDSGCGSSISTESDNTSISVSVRNMRISIITLPKNSTTTQENIQNHTTCLKRIGKIKMEIRAAKTFGKVLGIFAVCWLPFIILYPIGTIFISIPEVIWDIVFWLGYANSMMNPFVYALSSSEYKALFRRILSDCFRRSHV